MAQVPLGPQVQDLVHVLSQDILISSVLAHCGTAIQLTSHTGMQTDMSAAALTECFVVNECWHAAHVL